MAQEAYELEAGSVEASAAASHGFARSGDGVKVRLSCFPISSMPPDALDKLRELHATRAHLPTQNWPVKRESGIVDADYYLAETLPEGLTLAEALTSGRAKIDATTLLTCAIALAEALKSMEAAGLLHWQITPGHIYLVNGEWQRPLLLDTGEAGLFPPSESDPVGPLVYSPPERFGHLVSSFNISGDLYSLGLVLYELATNTPPVRGQTLAEIARSAYTETLPRLATVIADFPPMLSEIIARLTRKSATNRYHSALGLAEDLRECLKSSAGVVKSFALGRFDGYRELNYNVDLVGRERELAAMSRYLANARSGQGSMQLIGAPSGTGKSRMALEVSRLAKEAKLDIFSVKFSVFETSVPFSAIHTLLRAHSDRLRQQPDGVRAAWQQRLLARLGSRGCLLAKRFRDLADILPDFPEHETLPREEEERVFFRALAEFVSLLDFNGHATFVFIDDLQWSDHVSLQLLKQIAVLANENNLGSLYILGAFRSEEVGPEHLLATQVLAYLKSDQQIHLQPLDRTESTKLVECLLDERGPEIDGVIEFVFSSSGGIPFFIYEVLESVLRQKLLAPAAAGDRGKWVFDRLLAESFRASSGVQQLVKQRLSSLDAFEATAIKALSITGTSMPRAALERLFAEFIPEQGLVAPPDLSFPLLLRKALTGLSNEHLVKVSDSKVMVLHDRIAEGALELMSAATKSWLNYRYFLFLAANIGAAKDGVANAEYFEAAHHAAEALRGQISIDDKGRDLIASILIDAARKAASVFAYRRAKEYLDYVIPLLPETPPPDPSHADAEGGGMRSRTMETWLDTYELYADVLAIVEEIPRAITTYELVLKSLKGPLRRSAVYGKLARNNLYLYRYQPSMMAAAAGLKELNEQVVTSELWAIVLMIWRVPRVLFVFTRLLLGYPLKQIDEPNGARERAVLDLHMALATPVYFVKPLCAIAFMIGPTVRVIQFKNSSIAALGFVYYSVLFANLGLAKLARYCLNQAQTFLDQNPNPLLQTFVFFIRAYTLELPLGNVATARDYLQRSIQTSTAIGEVFWRVLAYQGLIHADHYASGDGSAVAAAENMVQCRATCAFEATALHCTLQVWQGLGRQNDLTHWIRLMEEAQKDEFSAGFETITNVYGAVGTGEVLLLGGQPEAALPGLKTGFWQMFRHMHRVAYCCYAPILYARALAQTGRPLKAIGPLLVAWLNAPLRVRLFYPQMFYATGEVLHAFGLRAVGRRLMKRGINAAVRRGWRGTAATLRLDFGQRLVTSDPEAAVINLTQAQEHFKRVGYVTFADRCRVAIQDAEATYKERYPEADPLNPVKLVQEASDSSGLKKRLETRAVLDLFLTLSGVASREKLLEAATNAAMACTGADHAVLFLAGDSDLMPVQSAGLKVAGKLATADLSAAIDLAFVRANGGRIATPLLRPAQGAAVSGVAVLLVPLLYEGTSRGLLYLGHRELPELFTGQSLEVISSLGTQVAISFANFELLDKVRQLNQELEQNLTNVEALVLTRTQELAQRTQALAEKNQKIQVIMNEIEQGILTFGDDLKVEGEYSRYLHEMFAREVNFSFSGASIVDVLFKQADISPDLVSQVEETLKAAVGEDQLNWDLNAGHLPRELSLLNEDDGKTLRLDWKALTSQDGIVTKVMLTIRDVSKERRLEKNLKDQDEAKQQMLTTLSQMLAVDRHQLKEFLDRTRDELSTLAHKGCDPIDHAFMALHTIKGVARTIGLKAVTDSIHAIEDLLQTARQGPAVDPGQFQGAVGLALREVDYCLKVFQDVFADADGPMTWMLYRFAMDILPDLNRRVSAAGLPRVFLEVDDRIQEWPGELRVLATQSLTHALNNAVDHGFILPKKRGHKVKDVRVSLHAKRLGRQYTIVVRDWGVGLNLLALRELAAKRTTDPYCQEHPEEVLFLDGFSTANEISQTSGRGVGLAAVRSLVRSKGGDVRIANAADGLGTELVIEVPEGFDAHASQLAVAV